jgi:hypothetical protein
MQSASPLPPREEYTDINIRENGEWYTGNRKIINTNVLDYFQSNLHRDEKGIYIFNRFGEFSEKGYVKIKGPVMPVIDLDQDRFLLKGDKKILFNDAQLILSAALVPYLKLLDLGCFAAIPSHIAARLAENFEEMSTGEFLFEDKTLQIENPIAWTF